MKQSYVKKTFSIAILATSVVGSSFSMDIMDIKAPLKDQEALNTVVAQTAERFLLSRPEAGWQLVPDSDFNKMKITPSEFWELKQTPVRVNYGIIDYPTIVYKGSFEGNNFSQAVRILTSQPAVLDCTLGTTFCQLTCQMELLGEYYDTFAREVYVNGGASDRFVYILSMSDRLIKRIPAQENPPVGCWFGMSNISAYKLVHPNGIAASENLFCVADGRFIGFGAHFDRSKTREEMYEDLFVAFMAERTTEKGKELQAKITKEQFMKEIHELNKTPNVGVVNFASYKQTLQDLKRSKKIADNRAAKKESKGKKNPVTNARNKEKK